jgi:phosphatidylglycerophosphate synthase
VVVDADALAERERYRDVVGRLAGSQKSMRNAPGWSRWVNRPLGRRLAALSYLRGLTPNQVTAISAAFTFSSLAVVALVRPRWPVAILVSVGLIIGYAFDAADGQLARLRGGGSLVGEWLDHVTDSFKSGAVHAAVLISWYRFADQSAAWLLAPLAFIIVSTVIFFAMTLTDQLRRLHRAAAKGKDPKTVISERAPALPSVALISVDYGFLCFAFLTLAWIALFRAVYVVLLLASVLFLVIGLRRWFAEIRTF